MRMEFQENGIFLVLEKNESDGTLRFLHFGPEPFVEEDIENGTEEGFRLVEVNLSGYNRPYERQGNKYIVTAPGYRMQYRGHTDVRNEQGRKLEFVSGDEETGIQVISHFQFFDGLSLVRTWSVVENTGSQTQTLDMISTFNYTGVEKEGIGPWQEKMELRIPFNGWQQELNWQTFSLPQLGLTQTFPQQPKMHSS